MQRQPRRSFLIAAHEAACGKNTARQNYDWKRVIELKSCQHVVSVSRSDLYTGIVRQALLGLKSGKLVDCQVVS